MHVHVIVMITRICDYYEYGSMRLLVLGMGVWASESLGYSIGMEAFSVKLVDVVSVSVCTCVYTKYGIRL